MENIIKGLLDPEFEDLVHQSRQIGSKLFISNISGHFQGGKLESKWVNNIFLRFTEISEI